MKNDTSEKKDEMGHKILLAMIAMLLMMMMMIMVMMMALLLKIIQERM